MNNNLFELDIQSTQLIGSDSGTDSYYTTGQGQGTSIGFFCMSEGQSQLCGSGGSGGSHDEP
jgi:hypothetical protein